MMTKLEKQKLSSFFDVSLDFLTTGCYGKREPLEFEDDAAKTFPEKEALSDSAAISVAGSAAAGDSMESVVRDIARCRSCGLCQSRKNTVPGEGAPNPLVLVIGEAPGADEDAQGRPFVGAAGQLLDKMLDAIKLSRRTNCFIANILKCRPPGNRDPAPAERSACIPFLLRQIALLKPKAILCAGRISAQTLLGNQAPMRTLRGIKHDFLIKDGVLPLFTTYHPSALLRDPSWKKPAWEDLQAFQAFLNSIQ